MKVDGRAAVVELDNLRCRVQPITDGLDGARLFRHGAHLVGMQRTRWPEACKQRALVLGAVTRTVSVMLLRQTEVHVDGTPVNLGTMHLAARRLGSAHIILLSERSLGVFT